MPGKVAVDFGTSNTVVARWDEAQEEGIPLHIIDYGKLYEQGGEQISLIPSLIHYTTDRRRWVGQQVLSKNLYKSPYTFRFMKRYIANRSLQKINITGNKISHFDAGRDFLKSVLLFTSAELNLGQDEVAFTVPVESFEHFEDWLSKVAESAGLTRFRLIDEASAAALGYGTHIQPGDVYLIFDFGGGTLDVALVIIEHEEQTRAGQRCRVLGKAGIDLGGALIDQWLFQEVLRQNARSDHDEDIRLISNSLLVECEKAKVKLSSKNRADISEMNPNTGAMISAEITRTLFEDILDKHDAYSKIDQTVRRAIYRASERGYKEEHIKAVLMVGGSSQIPSVQRTIRRIFGRERVLLNRPLDAVARGAAAFIAGVDFYDHIQHDYAIRYVNRKKDDYDYRVIVKQGLPYPTKKPILKKDLIVKASHDDQTDLGIAIFELSEQRYRQSTSQELELIFDAGGAARLTTVNVDEKERRNHFWMNENNPTFLKVKYPVKQGQPCYMVNFALDGNKRLLITARDCKTGKLTHKDYPVIKLA